MRLTLIKIVVIFGIILLATLLGIAINGGKSNSRTPIIILVGAMAAIGAVWKYKPDKEEETSADKQELDKNS